MLVDSVREMVEVCSSDGRRRFVSPAVTGITGWSPEEYLAKRLEETVHPEDRDLVRGSWARCLAGEDGIRMQYRSLRKDGGWLWLEALISGHRDPKTGKVLGCVWTSRDTSVRRAAETLRTQQTALLERQARQDHLTGLANRHAFNAALREEISRHRRLGHELSLILIDVDHFKKYNDRYGHLEGDKVLRQVGALLQSSVQRSSDLAARFGGEEFVLLLPMTDVPGAVRVAAAIRDGLETRRIPHADSSWGYVTVSMGIASRLLTRDLEYEDLLLRADQALYAAKGGGRNRVSVCLQSAAKAGSTAAAG